MANSSNIQGLQPKGRPLRCNPYVAGGTIYIGDPVKFNSSGQVVVAAASDALCGAAASYAVSGDTVMVWDDPNQQFVGQADDATVDAQTDINLNYDIVTGTAVGRVSGCQIDASTQATTATLPLKCLGIENRPGNALGDKAKLIVKINNHQLGSHTGTAGV
jgi:hypothetical protein